MSNFKKIFDTVTYYTYLNKPYYYLYGSARSIVEPYLKIEPNYTKITSHIYLGDISTANNEELLEKLGITHIVCCILGSELNYIDKFFYHYVPIRDTEFENIIKYFDETNDFIERAIKIGGKVLVHCMAGVSRSSTFVIAYLVYQGKGSIMPEQAISFVKNKRKIIEPNPNFIKQLNHYYDLIVKRYADKNQNTISLEMDI